MNILNNFKQKLKKENIIKSLLCSLLVSALVFIFFQLFVWFFHLNILISIIPSIISFGISFPLFYYKKFKYSEIQLAKRIDDLGLEERVITMTELEGNDSFIAKKQREDTVEALKEVNPDNFKIRYKKPSIFSGLLTALAILILSMSFAFPNIRETIIAHGEPKYTIEVSAEGLGFVIDYSKYENQSLINAVSKKQEQDQIDKINNKEIVELKQFPTAFSNRISVNYRCFEDIDATMVLDGANFEDISYKIKSDETHILMALPYKGYVFIGWSDGCVSPFREIDNYSTDLIALFDEVSSVGEDLPDKQKEPGDKDGSDGGESDGIGPEGNGTGKTNNDNSWGDGAKGSPANQVINGEIYYGDIFNQSYQEAVERIKNDTNLTDAQKKAITDYFESIRKN
mgnify:CR=1 FL=1